MVTGRCSGSSGSGCSASASAHSAAADRMVEEIEAAEALADLAHYAMREGSAADSGGDWTRRRKRVKSQSTPPAESVTLCSDLPQDRIKSPEQSAEACRNVIAEPSKAHDRSEKNLKVKKETELPKPSLIGSTEPGYSLLGIGKSRRSLTEAEKEARRIRRILANRESARQTIRRRQALCEELIKKAADLASENESLKTEMEMALKEYRMLETTNKQLKDRMAKVVKADVEEILGSQCVQITPTAASPLFLYNHPPFTPLFWSPVAQSPNSVQTSHIAQNAIVMPSNIPLPAEGRHDSCEQENLRNTNGPETPLYIFPCPWFFPHLDPGTLLQSQSSIFQKNKQDETSTNNQQSPTSSRTPPHWENQHSHMHTKVKTEPSGSLEARTNNDLNEHLAEVAQDGGDQQTGSHLKGSFSKEALVTPLLIKPVVIPSTIKHESGPQLDSTHHIKTSAEVCHATPAMALLEKFREPIIYSCKKSAEVVAAAEARKRRKELTKLKNLHGRQCRMHC
ncbi:Transcription factor HBP-1a [Morus notabilis]|uniref:Transcription factor HBP-1a n=1 Tax=Morus notabilis TaxID=981085 RepID=W9SUC6_9ROSA|nr:uncharacterized protein LOC21384809 isoform X2 [Morus notabilis]EXC26927.1 Transcription factor HBP-1a [Morus notabilis]